MHDILENDQSIVDTSSVPALLPAKSDGGATLLDGIDPDIAEHITSRRGLLTNTSVALGALATAPILLAATSKKAFALLEFFLPQQIIDVLNFALTLEYLERDFYSIALNTPGLIPPEYQTVFQTIGTHEQEHVFALNVVLGFAAVRSPEFDFTGGGRYPDVFSNFGTFAKLSQTFEDLGVRAYKGQATNLMDSRLILTTALRIHSLEARHAAEVRRVRGVRPWDGAFDEPLSKGQVLAAASPFIVGGLSVA
ncbi:MAG: ferritin-like domain-containing protein [Pseudolabrys sp.]